MNKIIELPTHIKNMVNARNKMKDHYNKKIKIKKAESRELEFTLDGNLVGDIGEAIAVEYYNMKLAEPGKKEIDGWVQKIPVQVKATGTKRGPSMYKCTKKTKNYFLFFSLDYEKCKAEVIFNGPENIIYDGLKKKGIESMKPSFKHMIEFNENVDDKDRLPIKLN